MATRSKNYRASAEKIDRDTLYSPRAAVRLAKETSTTKYDATVEVALRLGVDPRKADQMVRGTVNLPHGTGKTVRVLAITQGEGASAAEGAGADFVGGQEVIDRILGGWMDFDAVVATPDMMAQVGSKLGRVLGPRGLLPNPRAGTVGPDVTEMVTALKSGRIEFRADKGGVVHAPIGKASFSAEQLAENFGALRTAIEGAKPDAVKAQYLRSVAITSTMSPAVRVAVGGSAQ